MSDAVLMPRDSLTVLGPRLRGAGVALGEVLTWRWTGNADGSRALAAAVDSNKNRYNILQHSSYVPIIHKIERNTYKVVRHPWVAGLGPSATTGAGPSPVSQREHRVEQRA